MGCCRLQHAVFVAERIVHIGASDCASVDTSMIDAHPEAALLKMDNQHTKLGPGMPVCPLPS
eukprot:scaffold124225_cov66-Phaeocystis_antarctica.AAC.1